MTSPTLPSATRPVRPELTALLHSLKPGQHIRITQAVRVGLGRRGAKEPDHRHRRLLRADGERRPCRCGCGAEERYEIAPLQPIA